MTIPRAPVFAAYTSPGPKYKLSTLVGGKDHDVYSVYRKAPSYLMGARRKDFSVSASPGPQLSQTPIYRDGMEGSPKYSLKSRIKQRQPDDTPSPVIYNLEKSKTQVFNNAPQYSISLPRRPRSAEFTPAPKYDLPTMLCETKQSNKRRAPAYSILSKSAWMPLHEGPGPAVYNVISPDIYRNKQPVYSHYFRNKTWDQRNEKTPGPGSHNNEKNFIRAQDKVLLSQLQQCQDNIERLKRQRQQAAEQHGLQSLDDDTYWEDWEISEFDMEDKKNFGQHSLDSRRFARSNPELSKSLLAAYSAKSSSIKKDLEIHV